LISTIQFSALGSLLATTKEKRIGLNVAISPETKGYDRQINAGTGIQERKGVHLTDFYKRTVNWV